MLVQPAHENTLKPPQAMRFERFNPDDPRLAHSIEVNFATTHSEITQLSAVQLIHDLPDGTAEVVRCADVASFQNQDTCDVLPWYKQDGEYFLGIYQALRPVEAARELFGAKSRFHGILPQLPGGYLLPGRGDAWIERAVAQVCAEKVGAEPIAAPRLLGGGYFTSIGAHTEAAILVSVEVAPPPTQQQMRIGEDFHQTIVSLFLRPQEIVDRFFRGEIPDVRLLEATYRFCERNAIALKVPLEVSILSAAVVRERSAAKLEILSGQQLRTETERPESDHRVQTGTSEQLSDFIRIHHLSWQAKNVNQQDVTSSFAAAITRGGSEYFLDTFDVGCYFWKDDKLFMTVQRGPREAIGFRNTLAHSIKTDCNLFHNDGISGSLFSPDDSLEARQLAIVETVRDKTGCEPLSAPQSVGFYYPSSGFSTEGTYGSLVEIDPHQIHKCENDVFAVELNDLLELTDQGYIRDVRLSALAHTLSIASGYPRRSARQHDPEVLDLFNTVLSSGVELQHFLQSKSTFAYSEQAMTKEFRRSNDYAIQEFGGVVREYDDPEERFFFRATVPLFTYYESRRDDREWSLRVLHDTLHFCMGELSPYLHNPDGTLQRKEDGAPKMRQKEEYIEWNTRSECKAVAISDAVLAGKEAAAFSWRARSAEVFSILGVTDADAAYTLIEEIELKGVIPEWVLRHPRYLECRDVIVGRLLQFSALDRAQLQIFHKDYLDFPEVAETLAQFGRFSTSPQEFAGKINTCFQRIMDYGEGINPVKAHLNAIAFGELFESAVRVAYIERLAGNSVVESGSLVAACQELRLELRKAYQEIRELANGLNTIEPTDTRLECYQHVLAIKQPLLNKAKELEASALEILPQPSKTLLSTRHFPCFRSQKGVDFEVAKQQAYQMERCSFEAVGLSLPPNLKPLEMWE